jgi:thioredoxin reductase (NADPH)
MDVENVIILGSGPAGLTAGIYASRSDLKPLLISGSTPGGQLTITSLVENYPGFENGILGPELMLNMQKQAKNTGVRFEEGIATKVDFSRSPFTIWTEDKEFKTKTVIISTGASVRWLGLDGETRLMGKGVSGCATCDGPFFKDKDIVVVGGGDSAMEEALFLTKFVKKIYLVHRRDEFRASKIMQDRVLKDPKIEILFNSELQDIYGENVVEGVKILNNKTHTTSDIKIQGVFIAIGHTPNTEIFKDFLNIDNNGYIKVHDFTKTNIEGVFAAGDVSDPKYKQAVSSAGIGCIAAIDAMHFIEDDKL